MTENENRRIDEITSARIKKDTTVHKNMAYDNISTVIAQYELAKCSTTKNKNLEIDISKLFNISTNSEIAINVKAKIKFVTVTWILVSGNPT